MITLFLSLMFANVQTESFTVVNPAYNDHGQTMIVSANKTTHEQMWFTADHIKGQADFEVGDKVTGVFFKGAQEDQFIVIPNGN